MFEIDDSKRIRFQNRNQLLLLDPEKKYFLNFDMVFLTAVNLRKLRKAHCSPPLVGEDNSMVFTSHSVQFPATRDLRSLMAGNGTS